MQMQIEFPGRPITPQQAAIDAAMAGNWEPANRMELRFLNASHIRPFDDDQEYEDAMALQMWRGDHGAEVLWVSADHDTTLDIDTNGARWIAVADDGDPREPLYFVTDIDGLILRPGSSPQ